MLPSLRVILIRPRNPDNIGACARAMANFGHTNLVVLDPYEPIWQETRSAPGAESVVLNAQKVDSWDAAVKDCSVIIGTSSFHQRPLEHNVVELPNLHRLLAPYPRSEKIALVFGSERSGLSNDELASCLAVLRIPTERATPSMNLGQAVATVLYECRRAGWEPPIPPPLAPSQELEDLLRTMSSLGEAVDYPAGYESSARLGRLRQAFQGATLPAATVRFLLSFFRRLARKTIARDLRD